MSSVYDTLYDLLTSSNAIYIHLALASLLALYFLTRDIPNLDTYKKQKEQEREREQIRRLRELPQPKMSAAAQAVKTAASEAPEGNTGPAGEKVFTPEELKQYDGTDPEKPIYVAVKGIVYDVSSKKEMYGPGAGYHIFAGKDGSKGLGKSSLEPEDAVSDYSELTQVEKGVLDDWEAYYEKRYTVVGKVVAEKSKI